jgi:hypothetical protein
VTDLTRRELFRILGAGPVAAVLAASPDVLERAARHARASTAAQRPYQALFFTAEELRTVRLLADLILPADERSGSASDAGVPEFIDFTVSDRPALQIPIRGGLRWLDGESVERFGARFTALASARQAALLDDIAWPARAPAGLSQGVAFCNDFRDLVASGFFTSKMGMEDLRYLGNRVVPDWNGCSDQACRALDVSYDAWDRAYGAER